MSTFDTSWTSALSMTLLHSLWQGLAITLATALFLKVFTVRNATVKYSIQTTAFFLLFATILVTFFILSQPTKEILSTTSFSNLTIQSSTIVDNSISYLESITNYLQANQQWIVLGWMIGIFLFSLRFVTGILYLKYLRVHALPVDEVWSSTLKKLSIKLGIDRVVQLYESIPVQTPMAMGYLKPVILMPIGLMAGLSTQQVEVILIHELEHIRRHDYLINFIQSLGETIFFFNPFVWIFSAWIRNERENCCDDAVLREGYNPKLYATTLYELEAARLQNTPLALALTGNKNQLLNRIKRIMEHSAKNQKGKEKFIPVVLLVLGLVFASWLSINPKEVEHEKKKTIAGDTLVNPKKSTGYSRKSIITFDKNGKPYEQIVESFEEGDEEFSGFVAPGFDFEMPQPLAIEELADLAELAAIPDMEEFHFDSDLVPPFAIEFDTLPEIKRYTIKLNDERNSEYEVTFKSDFDVNDKDKLEKILAEVQHKIARIAPVPPFPMHEMEEAKLAQLHAMEEMRLSEMNRNINEDQMRRNEEHRKIAEEQMHRHEADLKVTEEKLQQFEKELTELLIKDGYLKKGSKMDGVDFNFTDEGIRVNGQKIKTTDEPKYRTLNHKYFGESVRHRPE